MHHLKMVFFLFVFFSLLLLWFTCPLVRARRRNLACSWNAHKHTHMLVGSRGKQGLGSPPVYPSESLLANKELLMFLSPSHWRPREAIAWSAFPSAGAAGRLSLGVEVPCLCPRVPLRNNRGACRGCCSCCCRRSACEG